MNHDAITVLPIDTDWQDNEYGETWTAYEAPTDCRWDVDDQVWRDGNGEETDPDPYSGCEGPMMNYRYPLPGYRGDLNEAADSLHGLPVCVVEYDGDTFLALTGGGMDLSWEICAAYVRLGYLPPVHFCDLPNYAGGPRLPEILPYCQQSLEVAVRWAEGALSRFMQQHREDLT